MKLLEVTTISETLEAFLLPFADHFRSKGWTVDAASYGATANEACRNAFNSVHDIHWSRNPLSPSNGRAAQEIRTLVESHGYDLVHVHTPVASFVTRWALRRVSSAQLVYTAHGFHFYNGGHPIKNLAYRSVEKTAGPWTDHLVVMNDEDLAAVGRYSIVASDKVSYVPGIGVDIDKMLMKGSDGPSRAAIRELINIPENAPVVLMVAEFIPRKRHFDALAAFARIDKAAGAHLVLVGTGPLEERTKELASQLGIADKVRFLGYRRDVPSLLQAADTLLLPSSQEGLPRSVMEAMVFGVPVVGSNIRGVRDLLADGAGVLFPVGDIGALGNALSGVVSSSELRGSLAAKGRERVRLFELSHVLRRYDEIFHALAPG